MLPHEDVIPMQMSVADGMKTIISGGAVTPSFEDSGTNNSSNAGQHNETQPE